MKSQRGSMGISSITAPAKGGRTSSGRRNFWLMCDMCNHLAQETEKAVMEGARMSNWVLDLKYKKYEVQKEMQKLEQKLKYMKEDLAWFEARKKELETSGLKGPIVTPSVLGLSQGGASAKPRAPKKKKGKQKPKRHPGLPSQEGQEYYKSYLAHL